MFISLWLLTACSKQPPPQTVAPATISVTTVPYEITLGHIPTLAPEPKLNNLNIEWKNQPSRFWNQIEMVPNSIARYSEWFDDTVVVWAKTPCKGTIQWQNSSAQTSGEFPTTDGEFWATLPRNNPYSGVRLHLTCDKWSSYLSWFPREHTPFPKVNSVQKDSGWQLQVLYGQGHILSLEYQRNQQWIPLQQTAIVKPFTVVQIPYPTMENNIRWKLSHAGTETHPEFFEILLNQSENETFGTRTLSVSHAPKFFNYGEIFATYHMTFQNNTLVETEKWVVGSAHNSKPLPSDQIAGAWSQEAFLNSVRQYTLPQYFTSELDTYIRMDSQTSDARLIELLPLLQAPNTIDNMAALLYHTSLYWDALNDRALPWTKALIEKSHRALTELNMTTVNLWRQWSFNTQMKVLIAAIMSSQNAQDLSSKTMNLLLHEFCTTSKPQSDSDISLMAHIEWLIREQSHWAHMDCSTNEATPIWDNPQQQEWIHQRKREISTATKQRVSTPMPVLDDVHNWWQRAFEQDLSDRYTNLRITMDDGEKTSHGRFHEWQFRPITKTLSKQTATMTVSGMGRLYLSEWQFASGTLSETSSDSIVIHRTLATPGHKVVNPKTLQIGQSITIRYHIHSTPNTRLCLSEWGTAGLTPLPTNQQTCAKTDANGIWNVYRTAWVAFDGRFKLPAAIVSNGDEIAHTNDLWLQTNAYTTRATIPSNMIQ